MTKSTTPQDSLRCRLALQSTQVHSRLSDNCEQACSQVQCAHAVWCVGRCRVKSTQIALEKAGDDIQGAVLASDAFFPFSWGDSVEMACKVSTGVYKSAGLRVRSKYKWLMVQCFGATACGG